MASQAEDFWAFSKAGRGLAELHLNYETAKPYDKVTVAGAEKGDFSVETIRLGKNDDKSSIIYNDAVKISGVPLDAYRYSVNGRSPIEWALDRYRYKIDKESGLKNDPNDWSGELGQPRYVLDLLLRLVTVSLKTNNIVSGLPRLALA